MNKMGNLIGKTKTDNTHELSELAVDFSDSIRIMTRVFVVFCILVFIATIVYLMSWSDRTTEADRNNPFVLSIGSEFYTLETEDGVLDFRVSDVEKLKHDESGLDRYLIDYDYVVKSGCVDVSKIVFAASYVNDSESPFGVKIVPCSDKGVTDIATLYDVSKTKGVKTASCIMELPESVRVVNSDIGSSASVSGKPSWVEYRF